MSLRSPHMLLPRQVASAPPEFDAVIYIAPLEKTLEQELSRLDGRTARRVEGDSHGARIIDRKLTSPYQYTRYALSNTEYARCEQLREEVASGGLIDGCSSLTQAMIMRYEVGDFIGVHADRNACRWNALYHLSGFGSVLEFFEDRSDCSMADIFRQAVEGQGFLEHPSSEIDLAGGPIFFEATAVFHQRRPVANAYTILSLCFA